MVPASCDFDAFKKLLKEAQFALQNTVREIFNSQHPGVAENSLFEALKKCPSGKSLSRDLNRARAKKSSSVGGAADLQVFDILEFSHFVDILAHKQRIHWFVGDLSDVPDVDAWRISLVDDLQQIKNARDELIGHELRYKPSHSRLKKYAVCFECFFDGLSSRRPDDVQIKRVLERIKIFNAAFSTSQTREVKCQSIFKTNEAEGLFEAVRQASESLNFVSVSWRVFGDALPDLTPGLHHIIFITEKDFVKLSQLGDAGSRALMDSLVKRPAVRLLITLSASRKFPEIERWLDGFGVPVQKIVWLGSYHKSQVQEALQSVLQENAGAARVKARHISPRLTKSVLNALGTTPTRDRLSSLLAKNHLIRFTLVSPFLTDFTQINTSLRPNDKRYKVADNTTFQLLKDLKRNGTDVRILTRPRKSLLPSVQSQLDDLQSQGVEVRCSAALHAKMYLFQFDSVHLDFDHAWFVGSANFTEQGFNQNHEVTVFGTDKLEFDVVSAECNRLLGQSSVRPY